MNLLAIDPAFRNSGWCIINFDDLAILDCGVITTKKTKKVGVFVSVDHARCSQEIATALQDIIARHEKVIRLDYICAESQSGSKSSTAAQLQGMAWGVISAVGVYEEIDIIQVQPRRVKLYTTEDPHADKLAVEAYARRIFPSLPQMIKDRRIPRSKHEHIYDAAAVGMACMMDVGGDE